MGTYRSCRLTERTGWTALGDPTRRAIFERLADRPRAVGELASELPVSRPAVSQHLKVLKDAQLVIDQHGRAPAASTKSTPTAWARCAPISTTSGTKRLAGFKAAVEQQTKES